MVVLEEIGKYNKENHCIKMIIVKLWGGLCNQLFQYAFGYALAEIAHDDLVFDIEFYHNQPGHVSKRKVISSEELALSNVKFIDRPKLVKPFENKYISHLIRYNTGCNIKLPGIRFIMEKRHHYYKNIPYEKGTNNFYDGYWQTARYFEEYEEEIRREFTPCEEVKNAVEQWRNSIQSSETVAIHIRRGDYLSKANLKNTNQSVFSSIDFYMKAIMMMTEKLSNPVFCFFSDDLEWCKTTFGDKVKNSVFVEHCGGYLALKDLFSIAACDHGIMSPSTFSWWGNWLRKDNTNSIVIAPHSDTYYEHFLMDSWIEI